MRLVLLLQRLLTTVCKVTDRGSKDLRYPRTSLSGWKFGAQVHSLPELRQEMYCAEKWAPCQPLPPSFLSVRWRPGGRDCWQNREVPPWGLNPNSTEGSLPDVCDQAVRLMVARKPSCEGRAATWLLILLPCKGIVLRITAPVSRMPLIHSQALGGQE